MKRRTHLRLSHEEDLSLVSRIGLHQQLEQPDGRIERALLERHGNGAANLQQRKARHGIERLQAAVQQHRQTSERRHVEPAGRSNRPHDRRNEIHQENAGYDQWQEPLHLTLRV